MGLWNKLRALAAGQPSHSSPIQGFRAMIEERLAQIPHVEWIRRTEDPAELLLSVRGVEKTYFIGNLFAETRDVDPAERERRIVRSLASTVDPPAAPATFEEAEPDLVPVVRAGNMFSQVPPGSFVSRPLVPFLNELVVVDHENGMSYVTPHELAEWDVPADQLFDAAVRRLALAEHDVEPYDESAASPIWHVARDDDYQSSRLLIPGWLAEFESRVEGRPIAAIPHRNMLLVTGDNSRSAIERIATSAEREFDASPRSISPALYTTDGNSRIVPYQPGRDHPGYNLVRRGHLLLASREYNAQKEALDAAHTKSGVDIYVGPLSVAQRQSDGVVWSFAAWTEGTDSMIPEAEVIALVGDGKAHRMIPWPRLLELAASYLEPIPSLDPPRYRARTWPNAATIAKLDAVKLEISKAEF